MADIYIVGGGLAGLSCAVHLQDAGHDCVVLESSDAVGGRVRTDHVDGYLCDRGFQVFLNAYPEAGKLLDLPALELGKFRPGALLRRGDHWHRMMDPLRCPLEVWETITQPIGSLSDKVLVGMLATRLRLTSLAKLSQSDNLTTESFLRKFGFSEAMIDDFFRAFYGGIFLERDLETSSRMFEFTFKMFTQGHATLPAKGMQAIPQQLADRLRPGSIRTNQTVIQLDKSSIHLASNERLSAKQVVVATDGTTAQRLLPSPSRSAPTWRSVSNLYFAAPKSPLNEPIIALNTHAEGLIHNLCVPSDVCASYAPADSALISVTVLGEHSDSVSWQSRVEQELAEWFGPETETWRHLKTQHLLQALPKVALPQYQEPIQEEQGVLLCGDHCASASIEGAIVSGKAAALRVLSA